MRGLRGLDFASQKHDGCHDKYLLTSDLAGGLHRYHLQSVAVGQGMSRIADSAANQTPENLIFPDEEWNIGTNIVQRATRHEAILSVTLPAKNFSTKSE